MTDAEAQTVWSMMKQGSWRSVWLVLEGRISWSSGGPLSAVTFAEQPSVEEALDTWLTSPFCLVTLFPW